MRRGPCATPLAPESAATRSKMSRVAHRPACDSRRPGGAALARNVLSGFAMPHVDRVTSKFARSFPAVAALSVLAVGCSAARSDVGADGGAGATPNHSCKLPAGAGGQSGASCVLAPPSVPSPDANAQPQGTIEADALSSLDQLIGRYVRGDILIYRGTVTEHDNQTVYGLDADGSIAFTDAIATLSSSDANFFLFIAPLCQDALAVFGQLQQDPTTTLAYPIGRTMSDELDGGCTGSCAPSFASKPSNIAWTNVTFSDASLHPQPFQSTSTVDLRQQPPCSLTWDDVASASSPTVYPEASFGLGEFRRVGNEMVYQYTGTWSGPAAAGGPCVPLFSFSIDVFVNLSNLADYGVRNFSLTPTGQMFCAA